MAEIDTCVVRVESFRFPQDHLNVPRPALQAIYRLATLGGWAPCGTMAPPDWPDVERWTGNYVNPQGQIIRDEDAAALLAGIEAMLPDIPEPSENAATSGNLLEWIAHAKAGLHALTILLHFGSVVITNPR